MPFPPLEGRSSRNAANTGALMAYSIDGATDGAIQDILCRHTQNYRSGAFWDFRPPHFEGVWRVPIYIGPPEWNVGESRGALLKS
jgi:hypothetical protein